MFFIEIYIFSLSKKAFLTSLPEVKKACFYISLSLYAHLITSGLLMKSNVNNNA